MHSPTENPFLPHAMSTFARSMDVLFADLTGLTAVVVVAVVTTLVALVARFPRREGLRTAVPRDRVGPQLAVVTIMVVVLASLFHRGFAQYLDHRAMPIGAVEVQVLTRQGDWQFTHANGYEETGDVHLPVGSPVALALASADVVHTVRVPELRVQQDVNPGSLGRLWFEATEPSGDQPLAVLDNAPAMRFRPAAYDHGYGPAVAARIHLISRTAYEALLRDGPPMPSSCQSSAHPEACWGEALYRSSGCSGCHSTEANVTTPAPSWAGIWGRTREFADGTSAVGDAAYVAESIRTPSAHLVRGYESIPMPAGRFSDRQVTAIAAYIRSLAE